MFHLIAKIAVVRTLTWGVAVILLTAMGCTKAPAPTSQRYKPPKDLAEWGLFQKEGDKLVHVPLEGVVPYEMNSPLFTDYTAKYRFVKLPPGTKAKYDPSEVFSFPVGTVIAKTFSYPHDVRDLGKGERLLETRLLVHREEGWTPIVYQWNAEQTGATLNLIGDVVPSKWIGADGTAMSNDYVIPDVNKCASCHAHDKLIVPIGPRARHINRDWQYGDKVENQLAHWTSAGILEGAPANPAEAPRNAVWDDPSSGTLDERARAWLEINCAHCHRPNGPAKNAGLDFAITTTSPEKLGIWKTPVAVGGGGGGRKYSIVPGKPDDSILHFRLNSTEAGVMMPEVGRRMVHTESVKLIREWIAAMPAGEPAAPSSAGGGN